MKPKPVGARLFYFLLLIILYFFNNLKKLNGIFQLLSDHQNMINVQVELFLGFAKYFLLIYYLLYSYKRKKFFSINRLKKIR